MKVPPITGDIFIQFQEDSRTTGIQVGSVGVSLVPNPNALDQPPFCNSSPGVCLIADAVRTGDDQQRYAEVNGMQQFPANTNILAPLNYDWTIDSRDLVWTYTYLANGTPALLDNLHVQYFDPEPGCDFDFDLSCDVADINLMFERGDLTVGGTVREGDPFELNNDQMLDQADSDVWLGEGCRTGFSVISE